MKASELRELSGDELSTKLDELKEELFNLRFQQESGQLADTNRLSAVRHDIARVMTVIRERELEAKRAEVHVR
jgi:large subunit ribosomal protein L29